MSEQLPLDAFEEQHEVKNISFMWSVIFGVLAVIVPLTLYLIFYFSEMERLFEPFLSGDIFFTTIIASFVCPYLASIIALFHAKHGLGVKTRGPLLKHGIYVVIIPCVIGLFAFIATMGNVMPDGVVGLISFLSVFYIPYIILGVIISAVQSYFMVYKRVPANARV